MGRDPVFQQDVLHSLRAPKVGEEENQLLPGLQRLRQLGDQRANVSVIVAGALRGDKDRGACLTLLDAQLLHFRSWKSFQAPAELLRRHVDLVGREYRLAGFDAIDITLV